MELFEMENKKNKYGIDVNELVDLLLKETRAIYHDAKSSVENHWCDGASQDERNMFGVGAYAMGAVFGTQETKKRLYAKLESYLEGNGKTDGV